jgi:hypothetical protein
MSGVRGFAHAEWNQAAVRSPYVKATRVTRRIPPPRAGTPIAPVTGAIEDGFVAATKAIQNLCPALMNT